MFDPDKFILTDIKIKTINGKKYYVQDVLVHDIPITILGEISTYFEDHVTFISKRPKKYHLKKSNWIENIHFTEYFEDIRNFFFVLAQLEPDLSSIPISLIKVCEYHIKNNSRIIDTDIYTYIDESLIVYELLLKLSENVPDITINELEGIWEQSKELIFEEFKEHIYITKYKMDSASFKPTPYLMKLV